MSKHGLNICYLVCEADGCELPVGVFDRTVDVGKFLGISQGRASDDVNNNRITRLNGMRYRTYRIDVGEDK